MPPYETATLYDLTAGPVKRTTTYACAKGTEAGSTKVGKAEFLWRSLLSVVQIFSNASLYSVLVGLFSVYDPIRSETLNG